MNLQFSSKRFFFVTAVFTLAVFLTACAIQETRHNRNNLKNIRVGMTREDVRKIMGDPLLKETYNTPDIWFYYTRTQWHDGVVTRDECTPLLFNEDGKLEGWGMDYYKSNYTLADWTRKSINDPAEFRRENP